ncbi:tryptophan-rich sensory protein [uncultured Microbacterium sp.]|uniref:Tryptophan-rich sensory protein n=1 Tax=uncultured Microbacterium sp. TaxID=191216 RepID=A0A1Y5P734_9MICO|nr:tryptophan-rich sensory protein [uncultured Microbacterium sp.]SBS73330.1 conserved membrane hypothetical protein [uncultured Microbacterium sp.]
MIDDLRPARAADLIRQIAVISAVSFMLVAALVGSGVFGGTPVNELQDGNLASDATYLAPGSSAFSIWSLIYLLMIAYAIWQALPGQRARDRQRFAGWWIAVTAVLNGCWLLAAQFLNLPATVVAILLLLVALGATIRVLVVRPPQGATDVAFTDLTVGFHLGWVSLATVANVTAWLTAEVAPAAWGDAAVPIAIAVLIVVAIIGVALAYGTRGRLAPGLAMGWGLLWIAVARATDEPASTPIAIAAGIAAAVVVIAPIVMIVTGRPGRGEFARRPASRPVPQGDDVRTSGRTAAGSGSAR